MLSSPAFADAPKGPQVGPPMQLSMEPAHQRVVDAARHARVMVAEAYQRSPVVVMSLGLAGTLPVLAALFAIGRVVRRRAARTDRLAPATEPTPRADKAWIDIGDGPDSAPLAFRGEILRIGRHSDNDIALAHEAVHRHHALIQRTPDDEFILMDLTAGTGNETLLNGRPAGRAALKDGDRITLGDTVLVFHLGVEAPAASVRPEARKPIDPDPKEMTDDERDAGDEPAGRAADGIATRRISPPSRFAARRTHRGRA
jgi:hypothetical protein